MGGRGGDSVAAAFSTFLSVVLGIEKEAMGRFKLRKLQLLLGGRMLVLVGVEAACFCFFWGAAAKGDEIAARPFWFAGTFAGGWISPRSKGVSLFLRFFFLSVDCSSFVALFPFVAFGVGIVAGAGEATTAGEKKGFESSPFFTNEA